jgi:hypothetical protein
MLAMIATALTMFHRAGEVPMERKVVETGGVQSVSYQSVGLRSGEWPVKFLSLAQGSERLGASCIVSFLQKRTVLARSGQSLNSSGGSHGRSLR